MNHRIQLGMSRCVPACAQMILHWARKPEPSQRVLSAEMGTTLKGGTDMEALKVTLSRRGISAWYMPKESMIEGLAQGYVYIIGVTGWGLTIAPHVIAILGYRDGKFRVHDPCWVPEWVRSDKVLRRAEFALRCVK